MRINLVYPEKKEQRTQRRDVLRWLKGPFLFTAYICPLLNIFTGGKAWSVIVLWSLYMAWTLVISPDLVEYNRISQSIKTVAYSCIMLVLIDIFLVPGWAWGVVPIVCFSGLTLCALLFYTDLTTQRQNMFPMLLLSAASFIVAVTGLCIWHDANRWALVVMGAFSLALVASVFFILGSDFKREMLMRFHTK